MTAQNFGSALGDGFVLNEATLMIGPLGSALDLTEEKHSFGLFKIMALTNDTPHPFRYSVTRFRFRATDIEWIAATEGADK